MPLGKASSAEHGRPFEEDPERQISGIGDMQLSDFPVVTPPQARAERDNKALTANAVARATVQRCC